MRGSSLKGQVGNLLVLALGALFVTGALTGLDLGTARRLGPGAFPLLAGVCVMLLAAVSIVIDLVRPSVPEPADPVAVGAVSLGIGGFALLTPLAGVLPAAFASALCTTLAARGMNWRQRLVFSAATVPIVWVLFFQLLNLPFVAFRGF